MYTKLLLVYSGKKKNGDFYIVLNASVLYEFIFKIYSCVIFLTSLLEYNCFTMVC